MERLECLDRFIKMFSRIAGNRSVLALFIIRIHIYCTHIHARRVVGPNGTGTLNRDHPFSGHFRSNKRTAMLLMQRDATFSFFTIPSSCTFFPRRTGDPFRRHCGTRLPPSTLSPGVTVDAAKARSEIAILGYLGGSQSRRCTFRHCSSHALPSICAAFKKTAKR